MKKTMKNPQTGKYHIGNNVYKLLIGSRTQVFNGTAYKTEGGLLKDNLMMNRWGRIVSKKKHATASKEKRLEKNGYFAQKGKFGYVRKTARKNTGSSASENTKSKSSSIFNRFLIKSK